MASLVNKFEKLLNKVSIKKSLRTIFIFLFILPVIIISIVFISYLYKTMLDWEKDRVRYSISQTESLFTASLQDVQAFSDLIYINKPLQKILLTRYDDIQQVYNDYANLSFLESYLVTYDQIANYRIYTENQTLLDNSFIVKTDRRIEISEWYLKALILKGKAFWLFKRDDFSKKEYVSLIRSLWTSDNQLVGVLVVNIDSENINDALVKSLFNTAVFVKHKIVYSAFNDLSFDDVKELSKIEKTYTPSLTKIKRVKLGESSFGIMGDTLFAPGDSNLSFGIMYIIPMRELIRATRKIIALSVLILLMMILLSTVVIVIFIHYLDGRVKKVQSGISNVVEKNFEIPATIGGNDEFEYIYKELYEMSLDIKNLINEVYKQNIEKEQFAARQSEMSFKMLSNQINPHFLFNTLETIRMKSISSGQKEVATMLKLLASLLRYNLSVKGQPVPLIQELEAIQNYLNIQHMRFADRVSYDIVTMCDVNDIMILPLLIQPLVENSFSHGLENRVSGGFIYILINTEIVNGKKSLIISVKDNGCGIDEDKLAELNDKLDRGENEENSTHIGVANVNSRIKLFYGNEYGLKIQSDFGEGTLVTIKIPV